MYPTLWVHHMPDNSNSDTGLESNEAHSVQKLSSARCQNAGALAIPLYHVEAIDERDSYSSDAIWSARILRAGPLPRGLVVVPVEVAQHYMHLLYIPAVKGAISLNHLEHDVAFMSFLSPYKQIFTYVSAGGRQ